VTPLQKIIRGTTEIIGDLEAKLQEGRPLVIKAGFDPTAPDIHLGHTVLLRKMKQFQDMGHKIIFLIGDFTAQVGDPTGRNELRKKMSMAEIIANAETYGSQVNKFLDPVKTKIVLNSSWLDKLTPQQLMELSAHTTVAQMLARADFKKRFESGKEISLMEFIYPLLQGYDSVVLKADVELGGSDQKFNLLMGRQLQEAYGQKPQVVILTPLLVGTDGVNKMSKSLGNAIGVNDAPDDMFGKVMSISDDLMLHYYEVLTDVDLDVVKKMHPKEAKLQLAQTIVEMFHPSKVAVMGRANFEKTFSQNQIPEDIPELQIIPEEMKLLNILVQFKLAYSKNDGRRLLKEGAITHNGKVITDENWKLSPGDLKVGKKRGFLRLVI
jgi:tyrosyl-tRNA synthetase